MKLFLSVVMPAYNETANFTAGVLNPTLEYLNKQKYGWEIVFVNDGSTDRTAQLLEEFCKKNPRGRLISIPHGGRAAAYATGMLAAGGKYILYTDFDQSTPIKELDKFLPANTDEGFDIVIGSRGGDEVTKRVDSLFNRFRAGIFAFLARNLFSLTVKDLNCGFKTYTNKSAKKIFSSLIVSRPKKIQGGYMGAIDTEILYLASKFGYKIKEIPVDWIRRPTHGNPWKEPIMVLLDLVKIKLEDLKGRYNSL